MIVEISKISDSNGFFGFEIALEGLLAIREGSVSGGRV